MVKDNNKKLTGINEEVNVSKCDVNTSKEKNKYFEQKIADLEQYSKKFDIVIKGIPLNTSREDNPKLLRENFMRLAYELDCDLDYGDVCVIHRLPLGRRETTIRVSL